MRHRKSGLKLNRTTSHREAMFRNMVTSLFKHDRIKTTDAKAKELRKWADHLVTLAKKGDLHARRQALSIIREKDVVHKLFESVEDRFGGASGGYTRVVKLGYRPGDAAQVSIIELVTSKNIEKKSRKKKKKKSKVTEAPEAAVESTASESEDTAVEAQDAAEPVEEKVEVAEQKTDSDTSDSDAAVVEAKTDEQEEKASKEDETSEDDSAQKDKTPE